MMKISIVPDTNVFISNLAIVETIFNYEFPWLCTLNISRTVLDELDFMKNSKPGARKAIKYIQSIALSLKVELEGRIDDRKLDVEIECKESVKERSNDDKILNYVFKLENPVLITNDVSFELRCRSFNIYVVSAKENNASLVISLILACFGMQDNIGISKVGEPVQAKHLGVLGSSGIIASDKHSAVTEHIESFDLLEPGEQPNINGSIRPNKNQKRKVKVQNVENAKQTEVSCFFDMPGLSPLRGLTDLDRFKLEFKCLIEPVLFKILFTEVGGGFASLLTDSSLEYYLGFISGHYHLFKRYFPKNSCSIIAKFLCALENKNLNQIILNARVLLVTFGYLPSTG